MKKTILGVLALLTSAASAHAQKQNCSLEQSRQLYSAGGGAVIYVGKPVFVCENGTRITADSGVIVTSNSRADFMGNVRFTEANRTMTSGSAQYVGGTERRLQAQTNV